MNQFYSDLIVPTHIATSPSSYVGIIALEKRWVTTCPWFRLSYLLLANYLRLRRLFRAGLR